MSDTPSDPSIAVVVLDTLRKDVFDDHFGWLEGRRYDHAYATANWTVPSHASLFCGKYASELGVHAKGMDLDCPEPTVAERLDEAGYTTRAFSTNPNVSRHFSFDRGFKEFTGPPHLRHLNEDGVVNWRAFGRNHEGSKLALYLKGVREAVFGEYRTWPSLKTGVRVAMNSNGMLDGTGIDGALDFVKEARFGDREFLFVNLIEAHEPYEVPEEYRTAPTPPQTQHIGDHPLRDDDLDADAVRAGYDDCARYLSERYRELFDQISESFDYVITTSDHGEMLGEHGAWGHEHGVYPQLTHVPLVISGPELSGGSAEPVSLLDLHQTVASLAGVETEGYGWDLLGTEIGDGQHLTEYLGLTDWRRRKLADDASETVVERYDEPLRGFADHSGYGYETIASFEADGDRKRLRETLSEAVTELDVRATGGEGEIPDELQSHLEDLGYA